MPNQSQIDVATLRRWLGDGGEIAFLDVREEGQHGDGHPLLAVNAPYSRLELGDRAGWCRGASCRVVLLDDGDGVAAKAARRLAGARLRRGACRSTGGVAAWSAAGYPLFPSTNVPSKAFAEIVELERHTPHVTAAELDRLRRDGRSTSCSTAARSRNSTAFMCRARCPARRRAGAPLRRSGARPRHAGRRVLRRPHPQHHRRAIADQCRRAEPGRVAGGRDAGLAAQRAGARTQHRRGARAGQRPGGRGGAAARRRCRQALRGAPYRCGDAGRLAGRSEPHHLCARCPHPARSISPATCRARSRPRAGNWCRRSTAGSAPAAPGSCWSTMSTCAR